MEDNYLEWFSETEGFNDAVNIINNTALIDQFIPLATPEYIVLEEDDVLIMSIITVGGSSLIYYKNVDGFWLLHNSDGPALIFSSKCDTYGDTYHHTYFLYGKQITKREWVMSQLFELDNIDNELGLYNDGLL